MRIRSSHPVRAGVLLACALLLPAAAPASGPGLGNLSYAAGEALQPIATLHSPAGHGVAAMLDGYLFVPFSNDGNVGVGGFDFFDVSNPRNPIRVSRTYGATTEPLIEPHLFGFHITPSATYLAYPTRDGISIWDVSDTAAPSLVSTLALPGLGTSGYDGVPWGLFWQAPYLFVGATNQGLYVVDTTNLAAPVQIAHVPTAQLGGFRVGLVYALGNFLLASAVDVPGLATLDVSDPYAPQLVATRSDLPHAYASTYFAGQIYSAGVAGELVPVDASTPGALVPLPAWSAGLGPGGYQTVQDDFVFGGFSTGIAKFARNNGALVGTATSGIAGRDEDFVTALGNLVFAGSDHHGGSALIVHATAPDTQGPVPVEFNPAHGATNLPLTTRIGVRFSDEIELESLDETSLLVRETGSATPLPGRFSAQNGFASFAPDAPLAAGTSYDVVVVAGGLRDWAGNPVATGVTTTFTTAADGPTSGLTLAADQGPTPLGAAAGFTASLTGAVGASVFSFDFGDGSTATPYSTDPTTAHTYSIPGNHQVTVTAQAGGEILAASRIHVAHLEPAATPPVTTSNLALLSGWDLVASANSDNDSVTLVGRTDLAPVAEIAVGAGPTALALSPAGELWVVCQDAARIDVIDLAARAVSRSHPLPRASRPYGLVFDAALGRAFVSLEASGELARLAADGEISELIAVGPAPRGLALRDGGRELWVSRFTSPDAGGEVVAVDADTFSVIGPVALGIDPGPDTEASGRGLPNALGPLAVSPDESIGVVPAKKDNILRGGFRDGQPLDFESSVRAMLAWIDVDARIEDTALRVDFNDASLPSVAQFSALGNLVYVAMHASRQLAVVDAYTGVVRLTRSLAGLGASGLLLDAANGRLFVHNELSRTLEVYYVGALETLDATQAPLLASVPLVTREKLGAEVLLGKRLFGDASDLRLARDSYLSCSACHFAGGSDGRVWDFTARGQGFRRTPSLLGRAGTRLGNVHWTANFDEIQDFEIDIRGAFSGSGLMSEADFAASAAALGAPKAGRSVDLDALAAYVASLDRAHESPHRQQDGQLTPAAETGRQLFFGQAECAVCHSGPHFSDGLRHDVGTLQPHSGSNGAEALAGVGFKTPPLTGVWEHAAVLHDGSATSFDAVFDNPQHGNAAGLGPPHRGALAAFLREIEGPAAFVHAARPTRYEIARGAVGEYLYVDRDETIASLTEAATGLVLVRTAADDLGGDGAEAVQFYLTRPAQVSVAYDADATELPPWLASWTSVPGGSLVSSSGERLQLYTKRFPAGNVALGGNQPAAGVDAMYAVLVEALDSVAALDPPSYALAAVAHTQKLYVDREFAIETAPTHTLGMRLIQTANDDKGSSANPLVSFDLTTPARLLVAFDDRATAVPGWLTDWVLRPGEYLTYAGGNRLRLYEKGFAAGPVALGGNQPAPGSGTMYVVLVDPLPPPPLAPPVPAAALILRALCAGLLAAAGARRLARRRQSSSASR